MFKDTQSQFLIFLVFLFIYPHVFVIAMQKKYDNKMLSTCQGTFANRNEHMHLLMLSSVIAASNIA